MAERNKDLVLRIGNLVFLAAVITVNALANILPIAGRNTGDISDSIPNLFVPAGITFSIWGLIYLLLLLFAVYQLRPADSDDSPVRRIGTLFMINSAANILWILTWHYGYVGLSLACMAIILVSLIAIYERLGIGKSKTDTRTWLFFRLPFSVYLGWISVATIANVTALLVTAGWGRFGLGEELWTVLLIAVGGAVGALALLIRRDIPYSLVIVWAYVGIILKRTSAMVTPTTAVVPAAAVAIGVIVAAGIAAFLVKRRPA